MGIFSYIKNVASGKIHKQNNLIHANQSKFLDKVSTLDDPNLIKDWIVTFSAIAGGILKQLIFEEEPNQFGKDFGKHIEALNEEKAFEIFKLIGGYFLRAFLRNKDVDAILQHANINKEEFKNKIFEYMDYNETDKEEFRALSQLSDGDRLSYFTKLHGKVWQKGFGLSVEGEQEIFEIEYFGKILGESFLNVFIPEITNQPFIHKIIER